MNDYSSYQLMAELSLWNEKDGKIEREYAYETHYATSNYMQSFIENFEDRPTGQKTLFFKRSSFVSRIH